ncbi:Ionotropic receptor 8a [Frankliniella occidentalis]|nr:Ionotropic receptor 8a [Frankliniella occidentalis]
MTSRWHCMSQMCLSHNVVSTPLPLLSRLYLFTKVCTALTSAALVLDMTWSGWERLRWLAHAAGVPYVQADVSVRPFLQAADDVLRFRNISDAALVFDGDLEMSQGIYYLVGRSPLRVVVLPGLDGDAWEPSGPAGRLGAMRPTPSMHVLLSGEVDAMAERAAQAGLVGRYTRWMLVDTAVSGATRDARQLQNTTIPVTLLTARASLCCSLRGGGSRGMGPGDSCTCAQPQRLHELLIPAVVDLLQQLAVEAHRQGVPLQVERGVDAATICRASRDTPTQNASSPAIDMLRQLAGQLPGLLVQRLDHRSDVALLPDLVLDVAVVPMGNGATDGGDAEGDVVGEWSTTRGFTARAELPALRRYFRIGIVESTPWTYRAEDGSWTGYCVDFAHQLSEMMDFDFEFVPGSDYGERDVRTGRWSGALGDLVSGRTDVLIADLTMTAQREEAIDFVPPYFEQSGISIVIRKPVRKTSLFKFMTVLRLEVWMSIVGALVATAVMVWLLDRFSPYSARNTKYPYPCREFTLKESFWFALTSFTPQGGGEAPKALSGRTLVASYWLFVVLMLATFTANLAAFLTVERMQTPVQSLEQLARQSRINYTVVGGSDTHAYFTNMKQAEDTLYRVWKEITLNASSDETQYRVWDYPIKEQYGHVLLAIERAGTLPNATVGFQKVLESEDAEFAFIHNAAHVRYEVSRNCNLTEVGEVFAEQPYAIAIQQGSYLQEELSRKILELQKDRYFEALTAKYWNYSLLGDCNSGGDNEGITLESLGVCGLVFALITLGAEVVYYKRKENAVTDLQPARANGDNNGTTAKDSMRRALAEVNQVAADRSVLLTKSSIASLAKQRRAAQGLGQQGLATITVRPPPPNAPVPGLPYASVFPRGNLY